MDFQVEQLLNTLKAEDINESQDRVFFKIGERRQELHKDFPLVVIIETSSYCNLTCLGCPYKDLTRPHMFIWLPRLLITMSGPGFILWGNL